MSKSEYFGVMNTIDNTFDNVTNHESLQLDAYTHITSPIRRIVDLINLFEMQQIHNLFSILINICEFIKNHKVLN